MYKDILLVVNFDKKSSWRKALPTAVDLCRSRDGRLHVLTVIPDFGMSIVGQYFPEGFEAEVAEKAMVDLKAFVKENVPDEIEVRRVVGRGKVHDEILTTAQESKCDIIVMASPRPVLKDHVLGATASYVVRHADCSVWVVRE